MYRLQDTGHPQTHRRAWELFGDMGSFLLRLPYHWVPQLLVTMNTSLRFCSQNVTVTSLQVASYWRGWHRFSTALLLVLIFPLFTVKDRRWIFLSPPPPFFPHAQPPLFHSCFTPCNRSNTLSRWLQTEDSLWTFEELIMLAVSSSKSHTFLKTPQI